MGLGFVRAFVGWRLACRGFACRRLFSRRFVRVAGMGVRRLAVLRAGFFAIGLGRGWRGHADDLVVAHVLVHFFPAREHGGLACLGVGLETVLDAADRVPAGAADGVSLGLLALGDLRRAIFNNKINNNPITWVTLRNFFLKALKIFSIYTLLLLQHYLKLEKLKKLF